MGVVTKTRVLSAAVMLSVGTLWSFPSQADQHSDMADYTVISPAASAVGFVTTDLVPDPSFRPFVNSGSSFQAHTKRARRDYVVVARRHRRGVRPGNRIEYFSVIRLEVLRENSSDKKTSKEPVARLVIERATKSCGHVRIACDPRQFPDQTYRVRGWNHHHSRTAEIRRLQPCPSTAKYRACCGRAPGSPGPPLLPRHTERNSRCVCRLSGMEGTCFRAVVAPRARLLQQPGHRPARLLSPS